MTQVYLRVFFVKYEGMYFRNGKSRVKRYKRELVYIYITSKTVFYLYVRLCNSNYLSVVHRCVFINNFELFHLKQYKTKLTTSTMINVTATQLQDMTSSKIQLDKSCRNSTRPSPPTQAVALLDSLGRFRQTSLKS